MEGMLKHVQMFMKKEMNKEEKLPDRSFNFKKLLLLRLTSL
jgi:hypothetical protein